MLNLDILVLYILLLGYWKDKSALGGEIATRIKVKHKNSKLKNFRFNVLDNRSDSLKVRVNVYDFKKRYPQNKILKQNIFYTIKQKKGDVTIDLEPYNIKVDDDFVIGIELVEVYGDTIEFAVSGNQYLGTSYKRYVSQDEWQRNPTIGMSFEVLSSVPLDEDELAELELRPKPEKITLYWDASLKMKDRDLRREMDFLKSYLNEVKSVSVEVITFGNDIRSKETFQIEKGRSKELITYLENIDYEGASNYSVILKKNEFNADAVLLFSDGHTLFTPIEPEINVPVFCISANKNANHIMLQRTSYYADGHYINLTNSSEKLAMEFILSEIQDTTDYTQIESNDTKLEGRVFSISGPIQGASIRVKNTYTEAQSNVDGVFHIEAEERDILVVNYLGMIEKEYEIINQNNIAILIKPEGELLDEVIVTGGKEKKEVDTGYGKRNEDAVGYDPNIITEDDIKPTYNNLADLITGKFPGVTIVGLDPINPKFRIRDGGGTWSVLASIEVDGNIYAPDQIYPPIDIQNIHSIVILKSLAAANRYGTLGRGGVIIIKTKTFMGISEVQDFKSALVTGNDYIDEGLLLFNNATLEMPNYLKRLHTATNYNEAKTIYQTLKNEDGLRSVPFYLDVSDYFSKWDENYSYSILTNVASVASENPKALRALAFKMEELGKNKDAEFVYEQIAKLRPKDEQTYRDLARIYALNGSYVKAMDLYKLMLSNSIKDVELVGLKKVVESELMHLLAFHRTKVNYKDLPNQYRTAKFKYDIRIVFEWNDSNTEFEFQFVNPQKKYFKWSHTKFASKDLLLDELEYGYSTEEFIIDDADPGEWIINIECLSKEPSLNPTYLKYTVFKNYGKANETREVKVIKLYQQQTKVTLDKFYYQ